MACSSREKCNLVAGKAALGNTEQCKNQVSRNKDGIPGEGPPRVVRRARTFGIQAGVTPCGKRFFPVESGAGSEGTRRASQVSLIKAAFVGFLLNTL